ncbi:hypothetical protein CK203_083567 [Vitis vinifera]|uniref:Ubiquitin thioesterase OTU n=1 Tax=Vitis vinifera TaxID=29760 RepID=A0A438BYC7_VITVI|nr:hypothetical protein CK203_083567 [Vitis vinifera]
MKSSFPPLCSVSKRWSITCNEESAALFSSESYWDGRCMFRALVKGMAFNKGIAISSREERDDADELRMAVKEIICGNGKERRQYEEALVAITVEESLKRYCQRIERPDFWGGESELLVLSKLCHQPIIVYIPEHELHWTCSISGA